VTQAAFSLFQLIVLFWFVDWHFRRSQGRRTDDGRPVRIDVEYGGQLGILVHLIFYLSLDNGKMGRHNQASTSTPHTQFCTKNSLA
jgi:hypothetical protein